MIISVIDPSLQHPRENLVIIVAQTYSSYPVVADGKTGLSHELRQYVYTHYTVGSYLTGN